MGVRGDCEGSEEKLKHREIRVGECGNGPVQAQTTHTPAKDHTNTTDKCAGLCGVASCGFEEHKWSKATEANRSELSPPTSPSPLPNPKIKMKHCAHLPVYAKLFCFSSLYTFAVFSLPSLSTAPLLLVTLDSSQPRPLGRGRPRLIGH